MISFWFLVAILVVANVLVHSICIVRYLRKCGHKHWTDYTSFRFFARIEEYKEIRENNGQSMFWYKVQWWILALAGLGITIWFAIIMCVT